MKLYANNYNNDYTKQNLRCIMANVTYSQNTNSI